VYFNAWNSHNKAIILLISDVPALVPNIPAYLIQYNYYVFILADELHIINVKLCINFTQGT